MIRSCGGCDYWMKFRNARKELNKKGLCEYHDWLVNSGDVCKYWLGIKYDRHKQKQENKRMINDEI